MTNIKQLLRKILGPFTPKNIYNITVIFIVNHFLSVPTHFKLKRVLLNTLPNISLQKGVKVVGPIYCTIRNLHIAENTWVGKNFMCNGDGTVYIGKNCDIAPEVIFNTGGHKIGPSIHRGGEGEIYNQTVGNGCWIGARSTFINNSAIGSGCVVASCACVTKKFENNLIVGGVPAKILKELNED